MAQKNEDKHIMSGFKEFAVKKGIRYLRKKIKAEDLDEIIDKIDDTFTDKGSLSVMEDTQILVGMFFLQLNLRIKELRDGKKQPRKAGVSKENKPKKSRKRQKRRRF